MLVPITGRSCSGKSTMVYEMLSREASAGKRCLLLVPEQFSFEAEKQMLSRAPKNALQNIEILSFSYMAQTFLNRYRPEHLPFITPRSRKILMGLVIDDLWERLEVYGGVKNRRRLAEELLAADTELKQACIPAEMLQELAEQAQESFLASKLRDISLLLACYNAYLSRSFSDSGTMLTSLAELLCEHTDYAGYIVAVDGFSGFTGDEMQVLRHLLLQAERTFVTFCLAPEDAPDGAVFALPRKSCRALIHMARQNNIPVAAPIRTDRQFYADEALSFCEHALFATDCEAYGQPVDSIKICACETKAQECEYAAAAAKLLISEQGFRYRDIAIIERVQGSYAPDLAAACKRYDLPVYLDRNRCIASEAPVLYLLAFLECVMKQITTDALMRMLKSGMSDFSTEDIGELDNYVLMYDIDGKQWEQEWKFHPRGLGVAMTDADRDKLSELNDMRKTIVADIYGFRDRIAECSGAQITKEIYLLSQECRLPDKLRQLASVLAADNKLDEARTAIAAWESLMDCLSDIYEVTGERNLTHSRYFDLLSDAIAQSEAKVAPSGIDDILIGAADRVRLTDKKAVIIVGVNDGVFPAVSAVSGLFTQDDRKAMAQIGAELPNDITYIADRERYITYKAFSYARERLYVTYAEKDGAGGQLLPSEIIGSFAKIYPAQIFTSFSQLPFLMRVAGRQSAFRYLAAHFLSDAPEITALFSYFAVGDDSARLDTLERLAAKTLPKFKNPENARLLYGMKTRISPSRLETYYTCPFRYFCKYGLKAEPRRRAELTSAQNGLAVHYVLQRIFDDLGSKGLAESDSVARDKLIAKYLDEYRAVFLPSLSDMSERMQYIVGTYAESIRNILDRLADEFSGSEFVTCDTELKLDSSSDLAPYTVTDHSGGQIQITGTVDRVDIFRKDGVNYLRVIDYKTGGKTFKMSDVFAGLNMQMLIYLMCLWQQGEKRYHGKVLPAGILYIPANIGEMSLSRHASDREIMRQNVKNAQMNGLLLADMDVLQAMGIQNERCYIPASLGRDGVLGGSVISLAQFERLHRLIDEKIAQMGDGLRSGDISPLPVSGKNYESTCVYCDYQSVCLHEDGDPDRPILYIPDEELYQKLTEEADGNEQAGNSLDR